MTESISIALLISIISLACTVINTFTGSKKAMKEQDEKDKSRQLDIEKNFVKINVKLDDFCETSKQIMADNVKKTDELKTVSEKLITVSERVNTLFKYKDDHEARIQKLEDKGE